MSDRPPFQIIIDTREQRPYPIPGAITGTLPTGDYSFVGGEHLFAIERKSLMDAFGSLGKGHDRFKREMERASLFLAFVVMVETTPEEFVEPEIRGSLLNPESIRGAISTYRRRYGIQWVFAGNRERGQKYVETRLKEWWREYHTGLWKFRPVEPLDLSPWYLTREKIRFAKSRITEI